MMFWHRGCPVAAVMGDDATVQVKVDLIRDPFSRKVNHVEICHAATEKWEWYSSNACCLNSHGMYYRLVSAKSSLRRLGL